jgi:hypothetical protein
MDKLQLTGQNLGRVFNSRSGRVHALQLHFSETKQPNLKLKTRPKQLLGSPVSYRAPRSNVRSKVRNGNLASWWCSCTVKPDTDKIVQKPGKHFHFRTRMLTAMPWRLMRLTKKSARNTSSKQLSEKSSCLRPDPSQSSLSKNEINAFTFFFMKSLFNWNEDENVQTSF